MPKLNVAGVVEWLPGFPGVMTSVETQDGKPVDGLKEENFTLAVIGSGGGWNVCKITSLRVEGSQHGFYQVFPDPPEPFSSWQSWMSDFVFTVEVESPEDRGQTLAINKCCGDDGLQTHRDRERHAREQ